VACVGHCEHETGRWVHGTKNITIRGHTTGRWSSEISATPSRAKTIRYFLRSPDYQHSHAYCRLLCTTCTKLRDQNTNKMHLNVYCVF
jgi:hypothetical protein